MAWASFYRINLIKLPRSCEKISLNCIKILTFCYAEPKIVFISNAGNDKEISPATMRKDLNIATGTMTKMRRNEEVALSVLLRICEYLDCNIGDICDAVRVENK